MKKLFTLIAITLLVVGTVNAQTIDKDTFQLNEAGVTASRFKLETVSAQVLILDSSKNFSQETPSFFSKTTSIISQSDNGTPFGYSYLTLRGMGQTRINYTMNGVPLNDGEDLAVYTSNYTDLIGNLRSVQLLRGAGISSNGASSYAGLINMDMKSPFDAKSASLTALYGSFNSYKGNVSYNSGLLKNHFGVYVSASNTGTDGFREHSFGKSSSIFSSFGYLRDKFSARMNVIYGITNNGQSWLPVNEGMDVKNNSLVHDQFQPQEDHFKQGIYQLQLTYIPNEKNIISVSPYVVKINGDYDYPNDFVLGYNPSAQFGDTTLSNLSLNSTNVGGYTSYKYISRKTSFEVGANANNFSRKHSSKSFFDQGYIYPYENTGTKTDQSIYGKFSTSNDGDVVDVNIQYRHAKFDYKGEGVDKNFFDHNFLNTFIGFKCDGGKIKTHISLAHTTREPSRTDIFGLVDNVTIYNVDSVNQVKPESVFDLEVGVSRDFGNLSVNLNTYVMSFENEITNTNQINSYGILLRKNVENSYRLGVEIEMNYSISESLEIGCNANLSKAAIVISEESKTPVLSPKATTYTYAKLRSDKLTFEANYKYVSESYLESSNSESFKVAQSHIVNASISYQVTSKLLLTGFANNLLNRNWQTSGNASFDATGTPVSRNYFYSSGSNFYLQATYKF